jgi:hypothetical protein
MAFIKTYFRQMIDHTRSRTRLHSKGKIASNRSDHSTDQNEFRAYGDVEEGYGLLPLNLDSDLASTQYEEDYEVDIVAVHGLGGRRLRTWRNDKGEIWLQKWLPSSLPGARVYTYGYNSDLVFSSSKLGIDDFAWGLLDDLKHRSSGKVPSTSCLW